jgi:hypothetical protein
MPLFIFLGVKIRCFYKDLGLHPNKCCVGAGIDPYCNVFVVSNPAKTNNKAAQAMIGSSYVPAYSFLYSCNRVFTVYQAIHDPFCGKAGDWFFARLQVSCISLMVDYFE